MKLLSRINHVAPNIPIVIVDDGSKKPTKLKLKSHQHLLRHHLNLGKSAALLTGIQYAIKQGADSFVLMDADLQHNPAEIPQFLRKLREGYDFVLGSRKKSIDTPLVRFLGNKFASVYIGLLFGVYVSDLLSGFRAFNKKTYKIIKWKPSPPPGYGVETEMIARLGKHRHLLRFIEVPIETIYVDKYKGVTIVDAFKILVNSFWWKLS